MRTYLAAIALAAMACGGGEQAGQQQTPAATPSAAAPATPPAGGTGTVHSVDMELRDGRYIYSPATLTIRVGDTVRWINVSGGPHNVAFYADKIPAGASDVLNNLMPNKMSPLSGALMIDSLAVYEITFTGSPAGTYEYFCLPHEALGMKATLTIQQ